MTHRVNLFRPIRGESPRASDDELTARGRAAFDGAASVGPHSASQVFRRTAGLAIPAG